MCICLSIENQQDVYQPRLPVVQDQLDDLHTYRSVGSGRLSVRSPHRHQWVSQPLEHVASHCVPGS